MSANIGLRWPSFKVLVLVHRVSYLANFSLCRLHLCQLMSLSVTHCWRPTQHWPSETECKELESYLLTEHDTKGTRTGQKILCKPAVFGDRICPYFSSPITWKIFRWSHNLSLDRLTRPLYHHSTGRIESRSFCIICWWCNTHSAVVGKGSGSQIKRNFFCLHPIEGGAFIFLHGNIHGNGSHLETERQIN